MRSFFASSGLAADINPWARLHAIRAEQGTPTLYADNHMKFVLSSTQSSERLAYGVFNRDRVEGRL